MTETSTTTAAAGEAQPDPPDTPADAPAMPNESYDWDGLRQRFREQADRGYPDAWVPKEPGEELIGVLVGIKPAVRTSWGPVPVLELEDPQTHASSSLWLLHAVLRRSVWRLKPAVGEMMYVRYDGRVKPESGGMAYESYTVLVDRPDENTEVDWEKIAQRYDPGALDDEDDPQITPGPPDDEQLAPPYDESDDIPF